MRKSVTFRLDERTVCEIKSFAQYLEISQASVVDIALRVFIQAGVSTVIKEEQDEGTPIELVSYVLQNMDSENVERAFAHEFTMALYEIRDVLGMIESDEGY